jgi:hypothetical protein
MYERDSDWPFVLVCLTLEKKEKKKREPEINPLMDFRLSAE